MKALLTALGRPVLAIINALASLGLVTSSRLGVTAQRLPKLHRGTKADTSGALTYSQRAHASRRVAPNFTVREFRSKDGADKTLIDPALVVLLQLIRDKYGPVHINSAYRSPAHNSSIPGAAANSRHIYGMAADIVVPGANLVELAQFVRAVGGGGVGYYPAQGFVHVDTSKPRSWTLRGGKIVSWLIPTDGTPTPPTDASANTARALLGTLRATGFYA